MDSNSFDHGQVENYPQHATKEKHELISVADSGSSGMDILDTENISYGKNGVAGIVSSGYIFGVAFLASLVRNKHKCRLDRAADQSRVAFHSDTTKA